MPFLRVDLAAPVDPAVKRELLERTAQLFAEILDAPVGRIRTQVHEIDADGFAVGGIPIAESGEQAPFISLDLLKGRPIEQHTALIERMSALVAEIVDVPIERTRLRINEVAPEDWGIAGKPAAKARKTEVDQRAQQTTPR